VIHTKTAEATQHPINTQDVQVNYSDSVIGAAIFDLSGLPKEYFTTADSGDIGWVQTIFQALGLQSLLVSSLQLEGFHHAVIHGAGYCAIVVRQRARYTALLVRQADLKELSSSFVYWMQDLEPTILRTNPRFSTV
jgi:hypothetical protein